MSQPSRLDRTFSFILKRMVETGQAPFFLTQPAGHFGLPFLWAFGQGSSP